MAKLLKQIKMTLSVILKKSWKAIAETTSVPTRQLYFLFSVLCKSYYLLKTSGIFYTRAFQLSLKSQRSVVSLRRRKSQFGNSAPQFLSRRLATATSTAKQRSAPGNADPVRSRQTTGVWRSLGVRVFARFCRCLECVWCATGEFPSSRRWVTSRGFDYVEGNDARRP